MSGASYDVIVIGSGFTGLTAAKSLALLGLSVANVEAGLFGGLITNVNEVEGEITGSGADLASSLMMEVGELGCATVGETAIALRRDADRLVLATDVGEHWARAVVVASGAKLKRLGVPGEIELEYKGVSQCADCDGPMFKGQEVVVVGGGDSALQEALVLSDYCATVHIVHHRSEFTAHRRWQDAIRSRSNVTAVPMTEVTAIDGGAIVEAVRLRSLDGGGLRTMPCAGVFVYVGLTPSAAFLPDAVERDSSGALVVDDTLETTLSGVFAAGAVRAGFQGTLVDAARDARTVANAVLRRSVD